MGNRILHKYVDDRGNRQDFFGHFSPELFFPHAQENPEYVGIRGEPLTRKTFKNIKHAKDFCKKYSDVSNFEVHGNQNYWSQFIAHEYPTTIDWDISKIIVANVDIETNMDDGFPDPAIAPSMITSITVGVNGRYHVFGMKDYVVQEDDEFFNLCVSEKEMLFKFLMFWKRTDPDVVTGWNIEGFDIPYLVNRIRRVMGHEYVYHLAPAARKHNKQFAVTSREREGVVYWTLAGISILDYMKMYKKFTFKLRERYSLDYICYVELGEKKLDYSEYGNLDDLYEKNPQRYVEYNIRDVRLVDKLDKKLNLLMLVFTLSYKSKIPFEDVFSQVRMWDSFIYNTLLEQNIVIPPKKSHSKDSKYEGAVVFEPKIGLHDWIVSFDLDGLYPHLMMQYNISPEMIIDDKIPDVTVEKLVNKSIDLGVLPELNCAVTANGCLFDKSRDGVLPSIMETIYSERKDVKRAMLSADSEVEKIKEELDRRGVKHD